MTEVALKVGMHCEGCVGQVKRVLGKLDGKSVESVDVDLAQKRVVVKGDVTPEAVKEKVSKTGLPTEFWT